MSLLPDDATFEERVQALFSRYRGRGFALSPKDVDLLEQWSKAEVPFEVIARGMRIAAEQALWDAPDGQGHLRSLRACEKSVQAELNKFLKRTAGRQAKESNQPGFLELRQKKQLAALKQLAKRFPVLGALTLTPVSTLEAAERREHAILAQLCRLLPMGERLEILRAARKHVPADSRERREELRFHRSALIRHHLGLRPFW